MAGLDGAGGRREGRQVGPTWYHKPEEKTPFGKCAKVSRVGWAEQGGGGLQGGAGQRGRAGLAVPDSREISNGN
jgi:hypothetical protein